MGIGPPGDAGGLPLLEVLYKSRRTLGRSILVDDQTFSAYDERAGEFAEKYENCSGGIAEWFDVSFPRRCRVLDIGAGSGRDLAHLLEGGWEAFGVEPSPGLIVEALRRHPELEGRLSQDSLPALSTIKDQSFDGILCSAVLMHLSEEELFDSIFSLRRILKPGGRLLISLPIEADGTPACGRDSMGRIFNGLSAGKIEWLLCRCGFRKIGIGQSDDALGRTERRWVTLLFSLEGTNGSRSIDRIEAVLNRDLARQEIGSGEILELLIRDSSPARNVQDSRSLFAERQGLECVWTGERLGRRAWEVDHAIPFSLWHNKDLWNLFPAASSTNRNKSDRLPSRELLKSRRKPIQETWETVASRWPVRFFHEAKVFGETLDKNRVLGEGMRTEAWEVFRKTRGPQ